MPPVFSMITVTLTPDEIFTAANHGVYRRVKMHEGKRENREQKERSIWDNEIEGACAELAWAKYWGQYWTGLSGLRSQDAAGAEVKWTRYPDGGLIINENCKNHEVLVLAKGFAPTFYFVGWITAGEGRPLAKRTSFGKLLPEEFLYPFEIIKTGELVCLP